MNPRCPGCGTNQQEPHLDHDASSPTSTCKDVIWLCSSVFHPISKAGYVLKPTCLNNTVGIWGQHTGHGVCEAVPYIKHLMVHTSIRKLQLAPSFEATRTYLDGCWTFRFWSAMWERHVDRFFFTPLTSNLCQSETRRPEICKVWQCDFSVMFFFPEKYKLWWYSFPGLHMVLVHLPIYQPIGGWELLWSPNGLPLALALEARLLVAAHTSSQCLRVLVQLKCMDMFLHLLAYLYKQNILA